ncbi:hypothetical protein [Alloactinosynnema sp. L-07]|nr:hypothetical protein [Alloactinosynnema sp. L-07]
MDHVITCGVVKRNITIQLDENVIRDAKVLAAQRGTSVSALLAQQVAEMTAEASRYEEAKRRALEALDNKIDRGGRSWRREDLYDQ